MELAESAQFLWTLVNLETSQATAKAVMLLTSAK